MSFTSDGRPVAEGHECTVYCAPPRHCDLLYAHRGPGGWDDADVRALYRRGGATVTLIEPAREAPPNPEAGQPGREMHREPILVWWQ